MSLNYSQPKIAIFIPSSSIGGAEHYVKNILYLIQEIGFKPTLILPKQSQIISFFYDLKVDCLVSDIAWQGDVEDLKIGKNYLNKLSHQYQEARKILDSLKPDIAFINLPWVDFGLGISLACHRLEIPCTNLVHLCPWKVQLNDLTKQLFQELAEANSKFFTVSYDNKIQLSLSTGIDIKSIQVFYNSRDVQSKYTSLTPKQYKIDRLELLEELKLPLDSFLSVSVGRFSHQKNFLDIITSFSLIHHKLPNYYHIFLGEGELKDYYQKIAIDLGLSEKIKFLGYRKDVDRFLGLSDLFISTSLYEGLALSILEAAQFSCPIIATNSSSAKEIIPSDEYGLLYNPGQYHLLGKYIKFAYYNPNEIKSKALKLKKFCQEKFSLYKFKSDLERILKDSQKLTKSPKKTSKVSLLFNDKNKSLQIDPSFHLLNYRYRGLPKDIIKLATDISFPFDRYLQETLKQSHQKYLHCLYKVSKKISATKIVLSFGALNTNFFRKYYLKDPSLLLIAIDLDISSYITFSLHQINYTYWGQDIEPDCLAKFTTVEQTAKLAQLQNINSNKLNYTHCYTSKEMLRSHLSLSANQNLDNLSIQLKTIDTLFKPTGYYLFEKHNYLHNEIDTQINNQITILN